MQKYTHIITSLFTIILLVQCTNSKKKMDNVKDTATESKVIDSRIELSKLQFQQSAMRLGQLKEKSFLEFVKTSGVIDAPPQNISAVSAPMGGYIKSTSLLIGDNVKKGQTLVIIENLDFVTIQQNYMEISKQLTYLKSEHERQKTLLTEKITSQKSFLKAKSEYKVAQAKYNGLRKQLTLLNISPSRVEEGHITSTAAIYAPISGNITKMNVTKGTYVSPADEILEIIDNNHIHLELSVFEKDIMKIKENQEIQFKIPEISSKIHKAEVHLIGTSIGKNRTIKVHGHLKNEVKHDFLTGMFVDADIVVNATKAKALPEDAIADIEGSFYVLILDEEKDDTYFFKQIEIQVGSSMDGYTAIIDNNQFKAKDKFLIKNVFSLISE